MAVVPRHRRRGRLRRRAASIGYVYLPALVLVVVTSMAAAVLGARLAHRLPVKRLRVIFALLLYVFAGWILAGVW
jgi:uncharacterized protein